MPITLQSPYRTIAEGNYGSLAGAHIDRQSRFAARSARRWGDWGVIEVPTPVLWLDDVYPLVVFNDECEC